MTRAAVLALLWVALEARAQGSGYPSGVFDDFGRVLLVADVGLALTGVVTGLDATSALYSGKPSGRAMGASLVLGLIHLGAGAVATWLAFGTGNQPDPVIGAIAAGHFVIAGWNLALPAIGAARASTQVSIHPALVSGRGAGGQLFGGFGVGGSL